MRNEYALAMQKEWRASTGSMACMPTSEAADAVELKGEVREKRIAACCNEVWSYGFVQDVTINGSRLRIFSIIDEHGRQCLMLSAAHNFPAWRVIGCLEQLMDHDGRKPVYIRSNNGPEFIAGESRVTRSGQCWATLF